MNVEILFFSDDNKNDITEIWWSSKKSENKKTKSHHQSEKWVHRPSWWRTSTPEASSSPHFVQNFKRRRNTFLNPNIFNVKCCIWRFYLKVEGPTSSSSSPAQHLVAQTSHCFYSITFSIGVLRSHGVLPSEGRHTWSCCSVHLTC